MSSSLNSSMTKQRSYDVGNVEERTQVCASLGTASPPDAAL